ncbi:MAG: cation transporter [Selenomonadaceae bacterium]|nr:cation transporter [Selenomonadaceae bacterium]
MPAVWRKFFSGIDERKRQGIYAGLVGICANLLLFAAKLAAGILSGAVSLIADAFNSFSDMGTSIVMLLGFKIAAQPADENHPFGYGRAEYLAGVFVAVAIIFVSINLFVSSVSAALNPDSIAVDEITYAVLAGSIAVKVALTIFYRAVGKKINSAAMFTAATDSLMDCISTGVVVLTMIIYQQFSFNADGLAGIFVAVFIFSGGLQAFKETSYPLLGGAPEPELVSKIKNIALQAPKILGVHDLIIHNYGPNQGFASMHVEMPADLTLLASHEIVDRIERRLSTEFNLSAIVHIDPIVTDNPETAELLKTASKILAEIDARLTLHDFRVVPYKGGRKLLFDVVVPQDFPMMDRDIRRRFQILLNKISAKDFAVIHFDHQYC